MTTTNASPARELAALNLLAQLRGKGYCVVSDSKDLAIVEDEQLTKEEAAAVEEYKPELIQLAFGDAGEFFRPIEADIAAWYDGLHWVVKIGYAHTCRCHVKHFGGEPVDVQRSIYRIWLADGAKPEPASPKPPPPVRAGRFTEAL
jgi:hypothetical protein